MNFILADMIGGGFLEDWNKELLATIRKLYAQQKEMLSHTDMPTLYVGRACGLGAPAHFSRLFKKMTGLTPLEYRRQKKRC